MSIDWVIETFDTLPSTMDVAHERARAGAKEGLVISALSQSSGRGRRGNPWIAPKGNLYFTLILRSVSLKDIGQYAFVVSVALGDLVEKHLKPGNVYRHKWPNDGLINDRKFAGILLESGKTSSDNSDYLLVGIGINIVSAPDDRIALNEACAESLPSNIWLQSYLEALAPRISAYRQHGFGEIRRDWLRNARGLGQGITVRLPNETFSGIFDGIDESGALLVGLDNSRQKVVHSGEVFFGKDI